MASGDPQLRELAPRARIRVAGRGIARDGKAAEDAASSLREEPLIELSSVEARQESRTADRRFRGTSLPCRVVGAIAPLRSARRRWPSLTSLGSLRSGTTRVFERPLDSSARPLTAWLADARIASSGKTAEKSVSLLAASCSW
jgi:hypothetical protein